MTKHSWFGPLLALLVLAPGRAQEVAAGDLRLTFANGALTAAAADPELLRGAGVWLYDGQAKQPVTLTAPAGGASEVGLRLDYPTADGVKLDVAIQPVGRCLVWSIQVANGGDAERWLEFGPALTINRARGTSYFDGWNDDVTAPGQPTSLKALDGAFPLAMVHNTMALVGVGIEPSELVSYLRHDYIPLDDQTARLAAVARVVVRAGATVTETFVTCGTPGEWGKYEGMEAYYQSFPDWFRPDPAVDPRANLGSAQYRAWPPSVWTPEIARRLYGGWDWCYAPFRRTGDIVGRAELWDYEPVRPFSPLRGLPREEYLKWRQEAVAQGEQQGDVAMMFYIPSQIWVEERLAHEVYADSLTTDPRARIYFDTPWVTGNDNELRVFPYLTSYGEASYRDLKEIAEALAIRGFAFDTAGDATRYTGPAVAKLEDPAWDEEVGPHASEMVAIAKLMDYVHTLERDGTKLAVVSNPMSNGSYASCFHSDSAMLERSPWQHSRTEADRLRWKMGQKTIVWWEGYGFEDFVDLDQITADQLATVTAGLADFTLLQSLRLGYIPPPNFTQGIARLVRWLPAIVDCVQTGWQPVPAARVPSPLWSTRYGRGLATKLAIAHETAEPVNGEVRVENPRLSDGAVLFSTYAGKPVANRLDAGETVISLEVPVRTPILLQAQLEATPRDAVRAAEVSFLEQISGATMTARLAGQGAVTLTPRLPSDMRLSGVTFGGAPVAAENGRCRLTLAGEGQLVVEYESTLFRLEDAELLDYPFVTEQQPSCTIVVDGATPTRAQCGFRLQEYFRYWYYRALGLRPEVLIPIAEPTAAVTGRKVIFRLAPGTPSVARDGDDLVIQAPDDRSLELTLERTLRALDRTYWTPEILGMSKIREQMANYRPEG